MATNLTGYKGGGTGDVSIVNYIIDHPALNLTQNAQSLAENLFEHNFMPYAEVHWAYDGPTCNCQDLAEAFQLVWVHLRYRLDPARSRPPSTDPSRTDLPILERVEVLGGATGFISDNQLHAVGGTTNGNIRLQSTGATDGRCLFPNHSICKIGGTYFDPTFGYFSTDREECVLQHVAAVPGTGPGTALWVVKAGGQTNIYLRDTLTPTAGFNCCYHEMRGTGWISSQEWKSKTSRMGHTRSKDLEKLDAALRTLETTGWQALTPLKTTFATWLKNNPDEAKKRNADNCVQALATFLGIHHRV